MNAKLELVRNWLLKAQRDLAAAHKLAAGVDPFLDIAVYHCQQAAEKAVRSSFDTHADLRYNCTHA
jgi:HEPN domain-containing protein